MNCKECRRHWELYLDSEGDSELYLDVNDHLATCSDCAKWFFQQQQFETLLTEKLSAAEPSGELWDRVLTEAGVVRPAAARHWVFFSSCLAVAATLLVAVACWQAVVPDDHPRHLSALAAEVHQTFAGEQQRIEFTSASDREVEHYLKQRVPFAVRCPPREDAGFQVRGGGTCALAGDPAAYVVGTVEGQDVSIFILPEERLAQFAHEREVLRRERIHHCREGAYDMVLARIDRNVVLVVGQGSPAQLERVVRAYGTYPEEPGGGAA